MLRLKDLPKRLGLVKRYASTPSDMICDIMSDLSVKEISLMDLLEILFSDG